MRARRQAGTRSRVHSRRQSGVALIQVLLVTGIIALLVLQLSLTARDQVARAQALADRAEAELALRSRESAIAYSLLTETWIRAPAQATAQDGVRRVNGAATTGMAAAGSTASGVALTSNPYAARWNFEGEPFEVDGATVSIQDESGRLVVPLFGAGDFVRLLRVLGVDEARARRLGDQLMQLQGAAQRGPPPLASAATATATAPDPLAAFAAGYPVQTLQELHRLPEMDDALYERLQPFLTLFPAPGFNPLTAPRELLETRVSGSQLAGVLESKAAGNLDATSLWKLTGIQSDDLTVIAPGPAFTVEVKIEHGGVVLRRRTTVVARPYEDEAWAIWSRT